MLLNFKIINLFSDQRWEAVKGVHGFQKIHHIVAAGNDSIKYSAVARIPMKTHRFSVTKAFTPLIMMCR